MTSFTGARPVRGPVGVHRPEVEVTAAVPEVHPRWPVAADAVPVQVPARRDVEGQAALVADDAAHVDVPGSIARPLMVSRCRRSAGTCPKSLDRLKCSAGKASESAWTSASV